MRDLADEAKAETWFVARRWPNGIHCPYCDSKAVSYRTSRRITPQYHCKSCAANFTVKTGTIMHNSKLPLSKWALGLYLFSTSLEGVSNMNLHRNLDITQKTAWHLEHRIREIWNDEAERMAGSFEADEACISEKSDLRHPVFWGN